MSDDINAGDDPAPALPLRSRGAAAPVRSGGRSDVRTEAGSEPRLTRMRNQHEDKFHIPAHAIPDGMTYEWKRIAVYGAADHYYENSLAEQHWKPVPSSRHPGMSPPGHKGSIIRDGLMLMERPSYLTEDARREEYDAARDRIATQEKRVSGAPDGTMTRDHPNARPLSRRSYAPTPIPAD